MGSGGGLFLGVDVGTSATRVSLVRDREAVVASAGYLTARDGPGRAEQDPLAWSRASGPGTGRRWPGCSRPTGTRAWNWR